MNRGGLNTEQGSRPSSRAVRMRRYQTPEAVFREPGDFEPDFTIHHPAETESMRLKFAARTGVGDSCRDVHTIRWAWCPAKVHS